MELSDAANMIFKEAQRLETTMKSPDDINEEQVKMPTQTLK